MRLYKWFFIIIGCIILASSCQKEKFGDMDITFTHLIDGIPLKLSQPIYINTAGNKYQVTEVKYFISKVHLIDTKGNSILVKQDDGTHFVDMSIPNSLYWKTNNIPKGKYTAISFIFGLDENDNKSNHFVNPPESNFFWPENLGGGYHYMQINGKFLNKEGALQNLNIHTGIGQLYDANNNISQYVHNYFAVTLPAQFTIEKDKKLSILLNMEIQRWFDTPNLYNFDVLGTGIMQNQSAQQLLKENGWNVFSITEGLSFEP